MGTEPETLTEPRGRRLRVGSNAATGQVPVATAAADDSLRETPTPSRASASGSLGPTFLSVNVGLGGPK